MKDRTRKQFRLTWQRAANGEAGPMVKSKTFASIKTVERHIRILTSNEPWREWAPEDGPDDWVCCSGRECGCSGLTHAQARDEKRATLPPIQWIRIEERTIMSTPFAEIRRTEFEELQLSTHREL